MKGLLNILCLSISLVWEEMATWSLENGPRLRVVCDVIGVF